MQSQRPRPSRPPPLTNLSLQAGVTGTLRGLAGLPTRLLHLLRQPYLTRPGARRTDRASRMRGSRRRPGRLYGRRARRHSGTRDSEHGQPAKTFSLARSAALALPPLFFGSSLCLVWDRTSGASMRTREEAGSSLCRDLQAAPSSAVSFPLLAETTGKQRSSNSGPMKTISAAHLKLRLTFFSLKYSWFIILY